MNTDNSFILSRVLTHEADTGAFAGELAAKVDTGDVLALRGDLGAGKTAFARAFCQRRAGGRRRGAEPNVYPGANLRP